MFVISNKPPALQLRSVIDEEVQQHKLHHSISDLTDIMAGDEPDPKKPKSIQDISSLTSKQYLDQLVVPHLLPALNAVSTNRPSDPIQYLVRPQTSRPSD